MSMKFVFEVNTETSKEKNFVQFIILSIIGLGINEVIMRLCVGLWTLPLLISKMLATAIVMVYNFISRKLLLEKH